jgi:hypothetical protein
MWEDGPIAEALAAMQMPVSCVPSEFGTHPAIAGTEREATMYLLLRPKPPILRAIAGTLARCRDGARGEYAAVHIRRTDFTTTFGLKVPAP